MRIEFKAIKPKTLDERQVWKALEGQITAHLKQTLQNVECPDHHEKPRLVTVSGSPKSPKFHIEGCCQKLIDLAIEALK